jgi:DNA replication and repair protein RecF
VRLIRLALRNYRNYASLDLEPVAGINLFLGGNGQGKTNLLEAVALLALSSSPRARGEAELLGPLGGEAKVQALVEADRAQTEIEIQIRATEAGARRRVQVNGVQRRAVDLPGAFRAVLFWPDDLALVKAGPESRRRFLNQMLVQVERGYARALAGYARVLRQRNHLLKQVAAHEQPVQALEAWDHELVGLAQAIVEARAQAVAQLEPSAVAGQASIGDGEVLRVGYQGPPDELLSAVQKSLLQDLRTGSTGVGPHRDDLTILLDGKDARSYASQGQQRTIAVSLKLAEAELIRDRSGEPPVLLLDDVLSELDPSRREALMARVGGSGQVILTAVEPAPIPPAVLASSRVHVVRQGTLEVCG